MQVRGFPIFHFPLPRVRSLLPIASYVTSLLETTTPE